MVKKSSLSSLFLNDTRTEFEIVLKVYNASIKHIVSVFV